MTARRPAYLLASVCAFAALWSMSCGPTRRDNAAAPEPGMRGQHWVQDKRLRGVMAELARQTQQWPAGVPDDPEAPLTDDVAETFRQAELLADGLARAAKDIPRSVADREMSDDVRRGFDAEARRLRGHAVQLKEAARGRKVERMQRSLDGISSSCISCHSQYRDFTGELDTRRADLR